MNILQHRAALFGALLAIITLPARGSVEADVAALRMQWEHVNFELPAQEQETAYGELLERCDTLLAAQPDHPQALTWCGIVRSSFAGVIGGLDALDYARAARDDFERAVAIEPTVSDGAALVSLGTLYARVPGWPVGFGNSKKALQYLEAGLEANPEGIDSNFFLAEFLLSEGETDRAKKHLHRVLNAAPRPGREAADVARKAEAEALLRKLPAD
jgi:tetratricopeptide (TPR) repeat protein